MPRSGELQKRQANASALGGDGDASFRRELPGKRCIEPDLVISVEHAHAVRADQAHPVGPRLVEHVALEAATLFTCFGEAGADDDQGVHARQRAFLDDVQDLALRRRDDSEVDAARKVANRSVAAPARDLCRTGVHRVDRSLEPVAEESVVYPASEIVRVA